MVSGHLDEEKTKSRAELRMALYDALPEPYRAPVGEKNATEVQMLSLLAELQRLQYGKPPSSGRLHRRRVYK